MKPFGISLLLMALPISTLLAVRGIRKQSLSKYGAIAAWCVGFLSLSCGLRGFVLLFFYQIGSWATKYKKAKKERLDATASEASARGPTQVLACSAISVILGLIHAAYCGEETTINFPSDEERHRHRLASHLACAILAHHSTCLADTLASEMGILATGVSPILITAPWRTVPPGTNGGVTIRGTLWSGIGGALMGIGMMCMDFLSGISPLHMKQLVVLGITCGLVGSLLDSFLGATLQVTYLDPETKMVHHVYKSDFSHVSGVNLLTNVQVNLLSVAITTFLGGWVLGPVVFQI